MNWQPSRPWLGVDIFRRRLSLWQQQQQLRQPHLAVHSEFLAAFANQVAAAHIQNSQPDRRNCLVCVCSATGIATGTAERFCRAVNSCQAEPQVLASPLAPLVRPTFFLLFLSMRRISPQCFGQGLRSARLGRFCVILFLILHNSLCL